jgi:polar amino acid transport system substrate-binding protein
MALLAVVAATMGSAQPTSTAGPAAVEATDAALPKLPADIANRKRLIVGVKCDTPPFGYLDVRGKNAGVDVEIAKWFARYAFGREQRVSFVCAPTALREPLLTNGRVDMVISTFTYTSDRDTRIDFSRAYYKASGRLLVKNNSPITTLNDIRGRRVATTSGSVYDRWMRRCFPTAEVVVTDSVTNAVIAFNQGRADAVMFDDTSLALIAASDPSSKMTDDVFQEGPYGIGIRQGNTQLKRWIDSRLAIMKQKDKFAPIIRNNIAPRFVPSFLRNVLRPNNTFGYRPANLPSLDTVCP